MNIRTIPRDQAEPVAASAAERQRAWRQRNPDLADARSRASKAKRPEHYRALVKRAQAAYGERRKRLAALEAAAARVTALWAAYTRYGRAGSVALEDAIADLAVLLPEKTP